MKNINLKQNAFEYIIYKIEALISHRHYHGIDAYSWIIKNYQFPQTLSRWYPAKRALPAMLTHGK